VATHTEEKSGFRFLRIRRNDGKPEYTGNRLIELRRARANAETARLLGLSPATDIGPRIDNLLRHPDFAAYLKAPAGDGITVASPRHETGWLNVQIIPYGTDQRLAIIRDVTNEKNVERTRRDFVANASHELRSPLTVISGYLEALGEPGDVPEAWRSPVALHSRWVTKVGASGSAFIRRPGRRDRAAPARPCHDAR
jgi:signal transduction histidine kinase